MNRQRKYAMVANWKCHGTCDFVRDIVQNLINDLEYSPDQIDFVVLPGMLHLNLAKARINDSV
jgi:triosephosphate isomerase